MPGPLIDVWDAASFEGALADELDDATDVIRNYLEMSRQYLEREASDRTQPYPTNPYGPDYADFLDRLVPWMAERSIRAWHYTRLTDLEVAELVRDGIHMSDLATIRRRLDAQIAAGAFSAAVADALFAGSPFHSEQLEPRSNKFWMTSHPRDIEDGEVKLLLESWGGEAVHFWQRDPGLQALLKSIGRPRVIEVAVPLAVSSHVCSASCAVVATYARTLGCRPDNGAFDLYVDQPLSPEAVLAIHSEGDSRFSVIARGYPAGFIDPIATT